MEVVKGTWGFIRRHRRTVTIGVGVAAAGWAVWKAKRFVDDYKRMMRELDEARFDQHRYYFTPSASTLSMFYTWSGTLYSLETWP